MQVVDLDLVPGIATGFLEGNLGGLSAGQTDEGSALFPPTPTVPVSLVKPRVPSQKKNAGPQTARNAVSRRNKATKAYSSSRSSSGAASGALTARTAKKERQSPSSRTISAMLNKSLSKKPQHVLLQDASVIHNKKVLVPHSQVLGGWMADLQNERGNFDALIDECETHLAGIEGKYKATLDLEDISGNKLAPLRTAAASDMMMKISANIGRFRGVFATVMRELLSAVYNGYSGNTEVHFDKKAKSKLHDAPEDLTYNPNAHMYHQDNPAYPGAPKMQSRSASPPPTNQEPREMPRPDEFPEDDASFRDEIMRMRRASAAGVENIASYRRNSISQVPMHASVSISHTSEQQRRASLVDLEPGAGPQPPTSPAKQFPESEHADNITPYFQIVKDLELQFTRMQKQLLQWSDKQQNMEREELMRIMVINRVANSYKVGIMTHMFLRWRYSATRRGNIRRGMDNVMNRIVEYPGVQQKKQIMRLWRGEVLKQKYARLTLHLETLEHEQVRLGLQLRQMRDELEAAAVQGVKLGETIAQLLAWKEQSHIRLDTSKIELLTAKQSIHVPKAILSVGLWIHVLQSLSDQMHVARLLNLQDPTRLLRLLPAHCIQGPDGALIGDETLIKKIAGPHNHSERNPLQFLNPENLSGVGTLEWLKRSKEEVRRTEQLFDNMNEHDIVLLWTNYHLFQNELKATEMLGKYAGQKKGLSHSQRMMRTLNLSRRCVNFESSFQDCEALVRLVIEILPNEVCDAAGLDYTLLDGFDHESRVRKLLGMLAAAEPNLMGLDLVRFEEVANGLYPDMLTAFLTLLMVNYLELPIRGRWFEEGRPAIYRQDSQYEVDPELVIKARNTQKHEEAEQEKEEEKEAGEASEEKSTLVQKDKPGSAQGIEELNISELLEHAQQLKRDLSMERSTAQLDVKTAEKMTSTIRSLPMMLEVAYLRNRLWLRLRQRMRCFVVHILSSRARMKPLKIVDHNEELDRKQEVRFFQRDPSRVVESMRDLAGSFEVKVEKKAAAPEQEGDAQVVLGEPSSLNSPRGEAEESKEAEYAEEDAVATKVGAAEPDKGTEAAAAEDEKKEDGEREEENARPEDEDEAQRASDATAQELLASELKLIQEIIIHHYGVLKSIFDRYSQADSSNGSAGAADATTMNKHEFWVFVREVGLARSSSVAHAVDSLFETVLTMDKAKKFSDESFTLPPCIRAPSDWLDEQQKMKAMAKKITLERENTSDIEFRQFIILLVRLAALRGISSGERGKVDMEWKLMTKSMVAQTASHLRESFIHSQRQKTDQLLHMSESKHAAFASYNTADGGAIALRFFVLLRFHVVRRAARVNVDMFRDQFIDSDVGRIFRSRSKDLLKIFRRYSISKTVSVSKSNGRNEELWANTMDYEEFCTFLKEAKLFGDKSGLSQEDVYSIFANVQSDAQGARGAQSAVSTQEDGEREVTDTSENTNLDLIYSEFCEALAAIASFKLPNPYVGLATRLSYFLDRNLLPHFRNRGILARPRKITR